MIRNSSGFALLFVITTLILVTVTACGNSDTVDEVLDDGIINSASEIEMKYYYFGGSDGVQDSGLWVTDGTAKGTRLVASSGGVPNNIVEIGNIAFFKASDGVHGTEPWISNGIEAGTSMVADINKSGRTGAGGFAAYNSKVYFYADDGIHGKELWVTNGTEAGTMMVADINNTANNSGGSYPNSFAVYNGLLYFHAVDGVHGNELWVTDGTEEGTQMVADIQTGDNSNSSYPGQSGFIEKDGLLYFTANDGTDEHLWATDGTQAGTVKVLDTPIGGIQALYNGKFYYRFYDVAYGGSELWATDGTVDGTGLAVDINKSGRSSPGSIVVYNGLLYMRADDGVNGFSLVSTDGTDEGTETVIWIDPSGLAVRNNKLIFGGYHPSEGREIWVSNGTSAGTFMIDVNPGLTNGSSAGNGFLVR